MRYPRRVTKKQLADLKDHPGGLFSGLEVSLFPAGTIYEGSRGEIWIRDSQGNGFVISAGRGPAGTGLEVRRIGMGPAFTLTEAFGPGGSGRRGSGVRVGEDLHTVSFCIYNTDADSQAFKRAYCADRGEISEQ